MVNERSIFFERNFRVDAAITEKINCEIDRNGELSKLSVKGSITTNSSRAKKGLLLVLSNAYRMAKIQLGQDVLDSKLPVGSSLLFNLGRGERSVLTYEVDPTCIRFPLDCSVAFKTETKNMECCLALNNILKHSSIMDSSIKNVEACLSLVPNSLLKNPAFQGDGKAVIEKDNVLKWSLDHINRKEDARLTVSLNIEKEVEANSISGALSISFEIPNRTVTGIFIDSIQVPLPFLRKEIPVNRIYMTKCEEAIFRFRHPIAKASSDEIETGRLAITKLTDKKNLEVEERLRITVRVTNLHDHAIKNLGISDQIPRGFRLVEGRNVFFCAIGRGETREISYTIEPLIAGEYIMPSAVASYESAGSRLHSAKSDSLKVHVRSKA